MQVNRRQFCAAIGAAGLSLASSTLRADQQSAKPLRVIAYNIYKGQCWPEDRRAAKQIVAENKFAELLAESLKKYEPDIVNFSESPSEATTKSIAEKLGMHYVRFPSGGNWPGTLLSRYEIVESQNAPLVGGKRPKDLFTRHWGRGVIQLPAGEKLVVHSAHLYPTPEPERRLREIPEMIKAMRTDLDAGRSLILMGDLNHTPDTAEYKLWMDAGLVDTFANVGEGDGFTIRADEPKRRIDYVMAAGPIAQRITESRPLFKGAFRLDTTDDSAIALSDHLPQLAVFGSGGM